LLLASKSAVKNTGSRRVRGATATANCGAAGDGFAVTGFAQVLANWITKRRWM
jgi:hypothetical protein